MFLPFIAGYYTALYGFAIAYTLVGNTLGWERSREHRRF